MGKNVNPIYNRNVRNSIKEKQREKERARDAEIKKLEKVNDINSFLSTL